MEERESDLIALEYSEGNEQAYEIADVVPYLGKEYAVLCPIEDGEDSELVILELMPAGDDENEELRGIDDADTLEAVFQLFIKREKELN